MTNKQVEEFEFFLDDCFREAICRELRLSNEERDYLQEKYPEASIEKIPTEEYPDGKCWYMVKFR